MTNWPSITWDRRAGFVPASPGFASPRISICGCLLGFRRPASSRLRLASRGPDSANYENRSEKKNKEFVPVLWQHFLTSWQTINHDCLVHFCNTHYLRTLAGITSQARPRTKRPPLLPTHHRGTRLPLSSTTCWHFLRMARANPSSPCPRCLNPGEWGCTRLRCWMRLGMPASSLAAKSSSRLTSMERFSDNQRHSASLGRSCFGRCPFWSPPTSGPQLDLMRLIRIGWKLIV